MKYKEIIDLICEYREALPSERLNDFHSPGQLAEKLNLEIGEKPQGLEAIKSFVTDYLKYSVNTSHDLYTNQLWSKVEESSLVGEFLAATTNTSMYTFEVAPVATLLEVEMIHHLSRKIWPNGGGGVMTSGGTASNLQALFTARNEKLGVKNSGLRSLESQPVILTASNCHYSIKRAANLLGLGHEALVEVPVNEKGSMDLKQLEVIHKNLIEEGKNPFCLVSTAGTTIEGSFDNLSALGDFSKDKHLWFHVDGAYGGSVLLSREHRNLMSGVDKADSLSWDFHKMLGLNLPCAFLFMKEKHLMKKALASGNDSYLFHDEDSLDLGSSSLQCGRKNDIIKLWLNWMEYGEEGLGKRVDDLFDQSQEFARLIDDHPSFDLLQDPQSINVCFRFNARSEKRLEAQIRDRLQQTGQLMINYSKDENGPYFRLAVTNPRLKGPLLQKIIDLIEEVGHELDAVS